MSNMSVTETYTLKHEKRVKNILCKVTDQTGDNFVLLDTQLGVQSCTCSEHREYAIWNSCPHMKFMSQPEGYTQVNLEAMPIGEILPSLDFKPHVIKIECIKSDSIFEFGGFSFEDEKDMKRYFYRLTLEEGKNKDEKNALTQLGRALRHTKKYGHHWRTDAVAGSRLEWTLHETIIRQYFTWLSFDEPLAILLQRAKVEYMAAQRKAQEDAWRKYQDSPAYTESIRKTALQVLGLQADATTDEIKSRYRTLAKETHPDVGGDAEKFNLIAEAYQKLIKSIA